MNDTSLHDGPQGSGPSAGETLARYARKGVKALASLQLTVVLFALSILLVFFGTLAQVDEGIWTVVDKYFRSAVVWVPFQLFAKFAAVFFDLPRDAAWKGAFPFPGGWLIGGVMLANLLAAHLMRFRISWKRSGILLIHSGLVLLMLGELVTGMYAVESTMTLQKGESANFIDDSRNAELAITDLSDPKAEATVTVPARDLREKGRLVQSELLPVDIRVVEFMKNSDLRGVVDEEEPEALFDEKGVRYRIVPASEEPGVKSEREDATAVRVELRKKGTDEVIAAPLLSLWQYRNYNRRSLYGPPITFEADGKTYRVELRNRRVPQPFTVTLLEFEHTFYPGTTTPKDFASTVRLTDPTNGENREVRIWMNHPLRYESGGSISQGGVSQTFQSVLNLFLLSDSETFYQAGYIPDDSGTVLQVVNNPGWLLPYVSCAVVCLGLLIHFGIALFRYRPVRSAAAVAREEEALPVAQRLLPWAVLALGAVYVAMQAFPRPPKPDQFDLDAAGKLPVLNGGRVKPLDTVARVSLIAISERSEFVDRAGKKQPAIRWLLDVISSGDERNSLAAEHEVFRIDNDQVLNFLGLKAKPGNYRYSLAELRPSMNKFLAEYERVKRMDSKKQTLFHGKIFELGKRLHVYEELASRKVPNVVPPQGEDGAWRSVAEIDEALTRPYLPDLRAQAAQDVVEMLKKKGLDPDNLEPAVQMQAIRAVESLAAENRRELADKLRPAANPAAEAYVNALRAYRSGQVEEFNKGLAEFRSNYHERVSDAERGTVRFESFFNHFSPFYYAIMLYLMVILLGSVGWLVWPEALHKSAYYLALLALAVHTFALIARMYIQGRPPVTNLYSSAVFIGWGGVIVGLVMERIFRNGIALEAAATLGATTLYIARFLAEKGGSDTLEMMQAVLDTNFWLATHVTTVTLGYMATYLAGLLATGLIVAGVFTTAIDSRREKMLGQMIYGVVCFATLLSFTGTVLGGIWADQSWGRFWGWDPKENGAVLVVIWNALILHARWCGLVKVRGMAMLALVGNMITTWSWFGTNQLGVGLHAYGFSKELAEACRYYWLSQLVLIGIALLPPQYWRSFIGQKQATSEPPKQARQAKGRKQPAPHAPTT